MKINIKKFMELSNISFETPAKIEAGHDVGKSTIFRAVLFAITGKDIDGKEFDGRIYPKKANSVSELTAEVEIEQSGVVFNKKAVGGEKRDKGESETELLRKVNITYSINNDSTGGKKAYEEKIQEVFGNFHLFCNPDYFRNLKTNEEKRKIFLPLVNIDKSKYFDGLPEKKLAKGRKETQEKLIAENIAATKEQMKVQEPLKIDIIDYNPEIAELRKQRQEATPQFTFLQIEKNNEIGAQISKIENSVFIPEKLTPLLPEIEKPTLIDVEGFKKELEKVQLSEPDTIFIDTQIERMKVKISQIKSLTLQIENYDENVKNSRCILCEVCTNSDCQFKQSPLMSLFDLGEEFSKLMPLTEAETSLQNFESKKIDYLRDFETKKESEILRLEGEIKEGELKNDEISEEYHLRNIKNIQKNCDITNENSLIKNQNAANIANFDFIKAQKIAGLKKQLHILPSFDYSEIDQKILALCELRRDQQNTVDAYNELNGAYIYAQNRIVVLTDELKQLKEALFAFERDLIKIEKAENDYYNDFENLINNEMPENIKVSLFKKNLSNDDYSECFEIEFNGSIYAGNGKTIAFYIWLCGWFQSKFGKDLPIFIDEAIILNEKLYSNIKNAVILMRNDECKTLKISEL